MAGFQGYVTRLWGTRAQRLRCYAAGSRPVEKDKNNRQLLIRCALIFAIRNVHAIWVRREILKTIVGLWKNASEQS
jgi:hypothetical protein